MGASASLMRISDGQLKTVEQCRIWLVQVWIGVTGEIVDTECPHPKSTVGNGQEIDIEPILLGVFPVLRYEVRPAGVTKEPGGVLILLFVVLLWFMNT